jgi:hypothetical protein
MENHEESVLRITVSVLFPMTLEIWSYIVSVPNTSIDVSRFYIIINVNNNNNNNNNSGGLVRQRTIPTERPLLVGEVSANFSG